MHDSMCIHENTTCDCLLKEHLLGRWIGLSSRWLLFCVHGLILYEQFNGPALSEAPSMLPALFETRGVVAGIDYKTSEAGVTSKKTTSCDVLCLANSLLGIGVAQAILLASPSISCHPCSFEVADDSLS